MIKNIILTLLISIIISIILGYIIIPILKRKKSTQYISREINKRHLKKEGTPTMGGIIFIISTILCLLMLYYFNIISISVNLIILLIIFLFYSIIGFIDDYLKIKYHDNKGLSIISKFFLQVIIAIIFYLLYVLENNSTSIAIFNIEIDLKVFYGIFILFFLVGISNAVNITDGLDGLCGGLSLIAFLTFGFIAIKCSYILGYKEISLFCFSIAGSLIGYLFFNFYPAKVFMGDLGSLSLGATLATIAILLKKEALSIIIFLPFIIEMLSSLFQIISIRIINKKIFLKSPLHHHFEELGYTETEIIKLFYFVEFAIVLCVLLINIIL